MNHRGHRGHRDEGQTEQSADYTDYADGKSEPPRHEDTKELMAWLAEAKERCEGTDLATAVRMIEAEFEYLGPCDRNMAKRRMRAILDFSRDPERTALAGEPLKHDESHI